MLPSNSVFHVETYLVPLFGKYVCYALVALSIDLIWGFAGILSLGHGAFFALGGYAMGMYLMRQIGTRGVYANPILPDFMVFLNWTELPVFWYGFNHFAYAMLMVVLVPGVLAFVFGWFAFRSRVTGVYLSIITQAMTYALMLGFFRNNFGFGGNNGLTDFKDILGFNVSSDATRLVLFVLSCMALAIGFIICRAVVTSKAGKVLIAIRDADRAPVSSDSGLRITSCSCSRCRPAWPVLRGHCLYRKSESSIRVNSSPAIRSKPSSGSRSADVEH